MRESGTTMVSRAGITAMVSLPSESAMAASRYALSCLMVIMRESAILRMETALPASMPNDCTAAIITNTTGTHIFAIKLFI